MTISVQQEVFTPGERIHEFDLVAVEGGSVLEADEIQGIFWQRLGFCAEAAQEGEQEEKRLFHG
jgi:hypothetical protein